ncbi:MAG: ATP-binding cassette domain-containing protein, partial [Candidatus Cryptobacteroides sp.]
MIEIKDLGFSYGQVPVLKNISMNLEKGRIYGLLGENGVGKTTLLTILCGLKKPQSGSINIDGYNPYDRKPSFLSNQYYLSDEVAAVNMKAVDYARNYGKFWEKFDLAKFIEIMQVFENDPQQKMNKMSCGQLKKTWISFALACNTRYIFMDEPTNGLDIPSKAQFRKAVTKYTDEESTLVISTHQVRDLENIIDPIIILDRQDVLLNASVEEISGKLFFDYSNEKAEGALYSEMTPGGNVQVLVNTTGEESKVNIEALFNAVHLHKELIKGMF